MKYIAIFITKMIAFLLHLIHRGGSLPGAIGLRIHAKLLKQLTYDFPIILVTGTNGKTSTSNLIAEMFELSGKNVITNRKGDNLKEGITTAIVTNTSLSGVVKADIAVLEVDELNIPFIIKNLPVTALVITNFFRDQLDRAREMEQLILKIEDSLKSYQGMLILNGNDPNVVRIKEAAPQAQTYYFGMERHDGSMLTTQEASEGKFCPCCGNRLTYDYYQYSHIGDFHCSECQFATPSFTVVGNVVSITQRLFQCGGVTYTAPQNGLYTMYNCMAVLCVANIFKVNTNYVSDAFKKIKIPDGRNERFTYNGNRLVLNLIKNPTGANEVIKVIEQDETNKSILLVLNDNAQDGTDISWIYDTFFDRLLQETTTNIICSGTRAYDMALRLKYAGYNKEIEVYEDLKLAVDALQKNNQTMYAIATYTALQPVRNLLRRDAA